MPSTVTVECSCEACGQAFHVLAYKSKQGRGRYCSRPCFYRTLARPRSDALARFWSKVDRTTTPDGCWPWTAGCWSDGYGQFWYEGRAVRAHVFAYEQENGPLGPAQQGCHSCDNPPCCRPAHVFACTQAENMADMKEKGRAASGDKNAARLYPERRARGERHGLNMHPEKRSSGERNGRAKLSDAQVIEIRAAYGAGGASLRSIAACYGVSGSQVHNIVRGAQRREGV